MIVAYARIENDAALAEWKRRLDEYVGEPELRHVYYDGLSGVRWLKAALRKAPSARVFVVNRLADLGRDVKEMLETINAFAAAERPSLFALQEGLSFDGQLFGLCAHLRAALDVYSVRNRRVGIARALATGARMGRPRYSLDDASRNLIAGLMDAAAGRSVSVRKAAAALNVSKSVASRLLREYREEKTT